MTPEQISWIIAAVLGVAGLIAIIVVVLKKDDDYKPVPEQTSLLEENAARFIDEFRTASAGIDSKKELDAFVKQNSVRIQLYRQFAWFIDEYNSIYKSILARIS